MADIPVVIGPQGLLPQQPAALLAQLLAGVAAVCHSGYTANLPGLPLRTFRQLTLAP